MREFISEVSVHRNVKMLATPSGPEATQMWSIQGRKIRFLLEVRTSESEWSCSARSGTSHAVRLFCCNAFAKPCSCSACHAVPTAGPVMRFASCSSDMQCPERDLTCSSLAVDLSCSAQSGTCHAVRLLRCNALHSLPRAGHDCSSAVVVRCRLASSHPWASM